jgi:maltose alpha-D-glucosyltransferase/alpha-amylase
VLHNFVDRPARVRLRIEGRPPCPLVNLLSHERSEPDSGGRHAIELEPYGYRWLRVGEPERPISDEKTRRR